MVWHLGRSSFGESWTNLPCAKQAVTRHHYRIEFDLMPIALFVLGLVAGIASGMFGIGGGVIIVPVLVTVLGFALQQATGTSLAALLMPVGIFAVLE
ncbi:MAG: sulfite exporter TauE/SafE family protein, partial [Anaerolineae bacterium]|nr:sulfite exporter TauE/SafE family protein [Anaerolineae bacterium]